MIVIADYYILVERIICDALVIAKVRAGICRFNLYRTGLVVSCIACSADHDAVPTVPEGRGDEFVPLCVDAILFELLAI